MARILVISPSGEVYDHDNVRWYDYANLASHIDHYHNIGDAFVFDSSLKLLNFETLDTLPIDHVDPAMIDRLNAEYDYVFLRGSNYVHAEMDWAQAPAVLRRLKIPVIAFGIGAQAPVSGKLELSEDTKTVLKLIADSTASLGVRGTYSAEVLNDLGIRNVRIIGCPTAFRNNNPGLAIRLPPLDQVKTAGVTLRREVSKTYAQDIQRYLTFHRDLVKAMADRFEVTLMSQGEAEEKKLALGTPEQKAAAMAALKDNAWATSWYLDEQVEGLYRNRMFYSDVVAEYERLVRGLDLVLGYRLHGNLMALANGTPSIYFTYDSRTVEFADTFKIPSVDVFSGRDFRLEEYWDQSRFDRFNAAYAQVYGQMRDFLVENRVDNKMVPRAAEPQRKVA
ncbi:polysaccharide pyruvyl transferase family protein [Bosea sp. SSUT16]|jgi:polysaccharide pyruvyl transferase WcaK-like protein|uniref:Polysaccharide pyruvyl transferase family protein n=1 Tax=Bosea spartocytisi TaxID=2773451 RepID=A0A927EB59_9HYPH|nr:polysaccharide pyruvyl transferase family protein [Bosea spartocytisi]MBD3847252.1 polysaccharide pyruvyl transferase family protein [Bosea spartocytisi]MCT4474053.1 polysaccharide pyruvyl transferase family protein [Bosea spartocytisi]